MKKNKLIVKDSKGHHYWPTNDNINDIEENDTVQVCPMNLNELVIKMKQYASLIIINRVRKELK